MVNQDQENDDFKLNYSGVSDGVSWSSCNFQPFRGALWSQVSYTNCLGDEDSKGYKKVTESNPYEGVSVSDTDRTEWVLVFIGCKSTTKERN